MTRILHAMLACVFLIHAPHAFCVYESLTNSISRQPKTDDEKKSMISFSFEEPKIEIQISKNALKYIPEMANIDNEMGITSFAKTHPLTFLQYMRLRKGKHISFAKLTKDELPEMEQIMSIVINIFYFLDMIGNTNTEVSANVCKAIAKFILDQLKNKKITWEEINNCRKQMPPVIWKQVYVGGLAIAKVEGAALKERNRKEKIHKEALKICDSIQSKQEYYENKFMKGAADDDLRIKIRSNLDEQIGIEACRIFNNDAQVLRLESYRGGTLYLHAS